MDEMYRVFNNCKYDIGVKRIQGVSQNIKAGSFALLSSTDILYIESICGENKLFSERYLIVKDNKNNEVNINDLGIAKSDSFEHQNDDEIKKKLNLSAKKFEEWLNDISDPAELFAIKEVAENMDLSVSKMNLIEKKINKE